MVRIKTVVHLLLITAMVVASLPNAWAEDEEEDRAEPTSTRPAAQRASNDKAIAEAYTNIKRLKCDEEPKNKGCKYWFGELDSLKGDDNEMYTCENASEKWKSALSKMDAACGPLQASRTGGNGPWPSCTFQIKQCEVCPNPNSDERGAFDCDNFEASSDEPYAAKSESGSQILKYCPGRMADKTSQTDLSQDIKDSEEKIEKLEEKVKAAEEKLETTESDGTNKIMEAQKKQLEGQKAFAEQLANIDKEKTSKLNQVKQQIKQMEMQYAQMDVDIENLKLSKSDIRDLYDKTIGEIELNCHATATNAGAALRNADITAYRSNARNLGGFNDLLKRQKDKTFWKSQAKVVYEDCLRSDPTKKSKIVAAKARDSALNKADAAIAMKIKQQEQLAGQMDTMQSKNGCPPYMQGVEISTLSEQCQAFATARQDAERITQAYQADQQMARMEAQQAQIESMKKLFNTKKTGKEDATELAEEKQRLSALKRLRNSQLPGSTGDKSAWDEALSAFNRLQRAAEKVQDPDCLETKTEGKCVSDLCQKASRFYAVSYGQPDLDFDSLKAAYDPKASEEVSGTRASPAAPTTSPAATDN